MTMSDINTRRDIFNFLSPIEMVSDNFVSMKSWRDEIIFETQFWRAKRKEKPKQNNVHLSNVNDAIFLSLNELAICQLWKIHLRIIHDMVKSVQKQQTNANTHLKRQTGV